MFSERLNADTRTETTSRSVCTRPSLSACGLIERSRQQLSQGASDVRATITVDAGRWSKLEAFTPFQAEA
jgi:hypothetical protein